MSLFRLLDTLDEAAKLAAEQTRDRLVVQLLVQPGGIMVHGHVLKQRPGGSGIMTSERLERDYAVSWQAIENDTAALRHMITHAAGALKSEAF